MEINEEDFIQPANVDFSKVKVSIDDLLLEKRKLETNLGMPLEEYHKTLPETLEVNSVVAFQAVLKQAGVSTATKKHADIVTMSFGSMTGVKVVENKKLTPFQWQFKNKDGEIIQEGVF